jgi:hypothetical protein
MPVLRGCPLRPINEQRVELQFGIKILFFHPRNFSKNQLKNKNKKKQKQKKNNKHVCGRELRCVGGN